MKIIVTLFLVLFLTVSAWSQNDTTYYFGVNGSLDKTKNPVLKKEITYQSPKKIKIETSKFIENEWKSVLTEKIKIEDESEHDINFKNSKFSENLTRVFEKTDNHKYKFTDWKDEQIKRTGGTKSKIPLIFDGEVTEYYDNGNKKSVSIYKNNQLISNQNWLMNGEHYIDSIFYSVDKEPRYPLGTGILHEHIRNTFLASEIDMAQIDGTMVVGFVVTEDGEIDGFKIEEGIDWRLNGLAQKAFLSLPGTWQPAKLNGENVRFYQLFPINFIYQTREFEYLELKGRMFNFGS